MKTLFMLLAFALAGGAYAAQCEIDLSAGIREAERGSIQTVSVKHALCFKTSEVLNYAVADNHWQGNVVERDGGGNAIRYQITPPFKSGKTQLAVTRKDGSVIIFWLEH